MLHWVWDHGRNFDINLCFNPRHHSLQGTAIYPSLHEPGPKIHIYPWCLHPKLNFLCMCILNHRGSDYAQCSIIEKIVQFYRRTIEGMYREIFFCYYVVIYISIMFLPSKVVLQDQFLSQTGNFNPVMINIIIYLYFVVIGAIVICLGFTGLIKYGIHGTYTYKIHVSHDNGWTHL